MYLPLKRGRSVLSVYIYSRDIKYNVCNVGHQVSTVSVMSDVTLRPHMHIDLRINAIYTLV